MCMCVCVCVCVCTTSSLSIHLSMDTACFLVLAIVNSAAVDIGVDISFQSEFSSFLDIYPGMGLLDHMATLFVFYILIYLFTWPHCVACRILVP